MFVYSGAVILLGVLMRQGGAADVTSDVTSDTSVAVAGEGTWNCSDLNNNASLLYERAKNDVRSCTHSLINNTFLYSNTVCHERSGCGSLVELMIKMRELMSASVTCGKHDEQSADSQLLFLNYWSSITFGLLKREDIRVIYKMREKIKSCSNNSSMDASFEGDFLVAQPVVSAVSCNKSETIEKCVSDILQQYPDTTHYVFLIFSAVRTLVGCNSLSMPLKRSAGQSGEYANTCGVTLVTVAVCVVVTAAALAAFLARRRRCGRAPEAVVIYNKQDDEATK